jgi:hypothetical protein
MAIHRYILHCAISMMKEFASFFPFLASKSTGETAMAKHHYMLPREISIGKESASSFPILTSKSTKESAMALAQNTLHRQGDHQEDAMLFRGISGQKSHLCLREAALNVLNGSLEYIVQVSGNFVLERVNSGEDVSTAVSNDLVNLASLSRQRHRINSVCKLDIATVTAAQNSSHTMSTE